MSAHGKRYDEARKAIDREQLYPPAEAIKLLKGLPDAKFDETVEAHFRLGLNVRHADQQLRGTLMLPHGTGKSVRVAVFAEGDKAREAEEAGADVVGAADLAAKIEGGFTDFDVAIATPDQMGNVGKLGRVLGPRGLMPNPKTGHGHLRRRQGRHRRKGRQARVPHRPRRERPRLDRQEELRREEPARELRGADRGDRPREAGFRQGPLHPPDHAHDDDGPRPPGRPVPRPRDRRGARAGGRSGLGFPSIARRRRKEAVRASQRAAQRSSRGGAWKVHRTSVSEPASVRARSFQGGERC